MQQRPKSLRPPMLRLYECIYIYMVTMIGTYSSIAIYMLRTHISRRCIISYCARIITIVSVDR